MSQGTTPPGWYDDGSGARRWWDGTRWTEHTQPAEPPTTYDQPAHQQPAYGQQPSGRGRKGLVLAVLGVVAALVVAAVLVAVVVLGGDDDTDQATDDPSRSSAPPTVARPTPSTATITPSEPEPEPEPSEPEPTATSEPAPDPADPGATTCGQIRAMSTQERLALLDEAARLEVARSGDEDAQAYLDLPTSQRRAFAEFLPTACRGEPDSTQLDDIDDF